jgi:hypothetical protein
MFLVDKVRARASYTLELNVRSESYECSIVEPFLDELLKLQQLRNLFCSRWRGRSIGDAHHHIVRSFGLFHTGVSASDKPSRGAISLP